MAVDLVTVTGNLETLAGAAPLLGRVWFRISRADWTLSGEIFAPEYVEVIADAVTGAFSVDLQSTDDFEAGSTYAAVLKYREPLDAKDREFTIGTFALPSGGPYQLGDLMSVPVAAPVPADVLALCQAYAAATAADRVQTGLDRAVTAADRVQTGLDRSASAASAAQAALYDGPRLDDFAAVVTDTVLSYTVGAGKTVVAVGSYVLTRKGGFAYQVAASGATDHHVTTAGGVKLYVLAGADGYSVLAFGAIGDGATDCTAAIAMVRSVAAARAFVGNTTSIIWPAGRYVYSASPNWAITGLEMSFHGEVWLILSGAGNAFVVDGGASGAGVYGLRIVGSPRIYGGPLSTFGVYARAIFNSRIEINVRGAGVRGVYAEWLVDNELDITMSGNEGGLYNEPSDALVAMSVRGAAEECSYNRVTLRIGGPVDGATPHAGRGLYLDGALGNTFSGTVQNCDLGAQLTANAWENKFVGMDFEGNTADVEDGARRSLWLGCDMVDGITVSSTATGCEIRSGLVENITVASGAIGAVLATRYNRTGAGTITDAGTKTYYDPALYNIVTQTFGKPKSATVLTVATPSYAYTNSSANYVQVSVYGGTVSGVILSHAGGYYTGATQGLFAIPSGSTITVESTVAPQMVVFA